MYSYIYPHCTNVGVGGYLLGGGINFDGTTNRYGLGSENVLEYTIVTANGTIIKVDQDDVTLVTGEGEVGYKR